VSCWRVTLNLMDSIGFVACKHGVGTSTVAVAIADAVASESGPVTIVDRGPNATLTRRFGHRSDRDNLRFADTPAETGLTIIDCPPVSDPACLSVIAQCAAIVIVTDTAVDTLESLHILGCLLRESTAVALAVVINKTRTDIYTPFSTLPDRFEHPALANIFDGSCTPTSRVLGLDFAHVQAANNGRFLSELDPARPDLLNTVLSINDELDMLRAAAKNTSARRAAGSIGPPALVRGVNNLHVWRPDTPAAAKPGAEPVEPTSQLRRQEFRINETVATRIDETNADLAVLVEEALTRYGPAVLSGGLPKPPARGKRLRRTCSLHPDILKQFVTTADAAGWTHAQLINVILGAYLETLARQ